MSSLDDGKRVSRRGFAWALYEGGRDPYGNLVTIFIFVPYFLTFCIGNAVKGQVVLSTMTTIYSLFVAATAPLLGATMNQYGSRKPLLGTITAFMIMLIATLWFARPNGQGITILETLFVLGIIGTLFAYSQVIHNAILVEVAERNEIRIISGLALSLANLFAVFALVFCLWAFVLPGTETGKVWSFVPPHPLLGLQADTGETSRIVAPIAAAIFLICALPLFFVIPDKPRSGLSLVTALRRGFADLIAILKNIKLERDAAQFLLGRMLFTDGMVALATYCGVLAAGVMGWRGIEMFALGIAMASAAALGGIFGGWLDGLVGPKNALKFEVGGAAACLVGQLGTAPGQILYNSVAANQPSIWNGPVFKTFPEIVYLLLSIGIALFVTAHYASSRTLLTRLVKPANLPSFFGLYALSGTATAWLGSLLLSLSTSFFQSQRAGFIPIAALLVAGIAILSRVKGGGRDD